MFDNLDKNYQEKIFINSFQKGDVFLKEFKEADHQKFFIIAGMSGDKIFICSVFINSNIHPSLFNKQKQLELQIPIKKEQNQFLKHDSYVNCAYPMHLDSPSIASLIVDKNCKVIGRISDDDLVIIQKSLINSGLLSEEEIAMYFQIPITLIISLRFFSVILTKLTPTAS